MNNQDSENRFARHEYAAKEREFYSIKRIDVLVISLSGAGVIVAFEAMKFIVEQKLAISPIILKWGGVCFAASILTNFLSQWSGYWANRHEAKWAHIKAMKLENPDSSEENLGYHGRLGDLCDAATSALNTISTVLMLAGICLHAYFTVVSF